MEILFGLLIAAIGLVIGSFLNVCIYRLPRSESVVFPASHCPACGKSIKPYDNIPVLSFIVLGGKCHNCRNPISLQYPVVEALTCVIFTLCYLRWGLTATSVLNSAFLSAIVVLIFIDYHHQILPNIITLPGILIGIALCPLQWRELYQDRLTYDLSRMISSSRPMAVTPWTGSLLGAVIGGGSLFLVGFLYQLLRKKQGLGMGDVKMMAMVGAFLGWRLSLLVIFTGSTIGSVIGVFLILCKGETLQTKLAFGTFLGMATILAAFWGISLLQWYAGIL